MEILFVAATQAEVAEYQSVVIKNNYPVDILVTGAGMVPTAFMLGQHLTMRQYDVIINVGVAGSFRRDIELGSVVRIVNDQFSELGAEAKDHFLSFEEISLGQSCYQEKLPEKLRRCSAIDELNTMKAITVNTVHGNQESIKKIITRINPDLESMEGAAVFYVADKLDIPVLQVRSISNYVEERNREAWNMHTAIINLNNWLNRLSAEIYS